MKNIIANPEPAKVISRASECMRRLMEAGLTYGDMQMPIDDPEMRNRLVRFWRSGGYGATMTQKLARDIMGKNFFGIEEAIKYFGIKPSSQQLAAFSKVPFSEGVLERLRDTHVLVAVFPLSILEIRGKVIEQDLFSGSYKEAWYNNESFAKEQGEASWQLIRKAPKFVPTKGFWSRMSEKETVPLSKDDLFPAQVMVYAIIGHYLATGERLFEAYLTPTSSRDFEGRYVYVGLSFGCLSIGSYRMKTGEDFRAFQPVGWSE